MRASPSVADTDTRMGSPPLGSDRPFGALSGKAGAMTLFIFLASPKGPLCCHGVLPLSLAFTAASFLHPAIMLPHADPDGAGQMALGSPPSVSMSPPGPQRERGDSFLSNGECSSCATSAPASPFSLGDSAHPAWAYLPLRERPSGPSFFCTFSSCAGRVVADCLPRALRQTASEMCSS